MRACPPTHEFSNRLHDCMFGARIQRAGWLVSRRMGASLRKARAIPMRWRCPTLRWLPRSPTALLNPCAIFMMKS